MDRRPWAIVTVVAICAIATALHVAWAYALNQRMPSESPLLAPDAFPLLMEAAATLGCLLAMWAALGGEPRPWRLVAALAAVSAVSATIGLEPILKPVLSHWQPCGLRSLPTLPMRFQDRLLVPLDMQVSETPWSWCTMVGLIASDCLGTIVNASFLMLALRFAGLTSSRLDAHGLEDKPHRSQFSLRSLLEWTAGVAVLLSLLRFNLKDFSLLFVRSFVFCGGGFVLTSLAMLWMLLGTKGPWTMRVVVGCLLGLGSGCTLWRIGDSGLPDAYFSRAVGLHILWMATSLWPFRWAGYRLVWRERFVL